MIDKPINIFLEELSSLSPLTGEYEAILVTLDIYLNLLKKNIELTKTRINDEQLNGFSNLINESISSSSKYYSFSNNYINSYMQLIKMPKSNNEEINKYHTLLQDLTIEKITHYINISTNIKKLIQTYNDCEYIFKDEHKLTNKLCISNMDTIKKYFINICKTLCSDIEDEKIAFDLLSNLNEI